MDKSSPNKGQQGKDNIKLGVRILSLNLINTFKRGLKAEFQSYVEVKNQTLTKMPPLKMNIIILRNPEQHMATGDGPRCERQTQQQGASVPGIPPTSFTNHPQV